MSDSNSDVIYRLKHQKSYEWGSLAEAIRVIKSEMLIMHILEINIQLSSVKNDRDVTKIIS